MWTRCGASEYIRKFSAMQGKAIDGINALPDIKLFLKSAHEMKYLLILTMSSALFQENANRVLFKLL